MDPSPGASGQRRWPPPFSPERKPTGHASRLSRFGLFPQPVPGNRGTLTTCFLRSFSRLLRIRRMANSTIRSLDCSSVFGRLLGRKQRTSFSGFQTAKSVIPCVFVAGQQALGHVGKLARMHCRPAQAGSIKEAAV